MSMAARMLCVLTGVLVLAPSGPRVLAAANCDRACLKTTLDQYLAAVVKHDPAAAPLLVAFRQTENAVVQRLGTGAWKSITGLGKVQRRYLDPVSGQAAYFGIIEETAGPAIATLRLKIDDRKITEAEWIIARKDEWGPNGPGGNLMNPDSLIAKPPMER